MSSAPPTPSHGPSPTARAPQEHGSPSPQERAFSLLLQPEGWELLSSLPPYSDAEALSLGAKLREEGHAPELVSAALTQSRLRARAVPKFGEFASSMLLTENGLEQATRLTIAAIHARRFLDAGVEAVADLGSGIGGDAMAMAALGLDVRAIDRDEVAVAAATVNLRPFPGASAELGDAEPFDVEAWRDSGAPGTRGIWMDPARRRITGAERATRLSDPEEYSPPLSLVAAHARRLGTGGADGPLGAKLGPAIPHASLPEGAETEWVSWHGQVLEADAWFGPLAAAGVSRSALVIGADGAARLTDADGPGADPEPRPLGAHLYEPDGAVIRAGLIGVLAARLGAATIDPTIAYLTSDEAVRTPFARGYQVIGSFPFSLKRLTSYLREHRLGKLEIKKRGTALVPEELRRRLRPQRFGDGSATVVLTRIAGEQSVIIAQPHPAA